MHNYIDVNKVHDFSEEITMERVFDDVVNKYGVTGIAEWHDVAWEFCWHFFSDYEHKAANYLSYIEPGMSARMFAELRKSAILSAVDEFYLGHKTLDTVDDVKAYRTAFCKEHCNKDYEDFDWQYFVLCNAHVPLERRNDSMEFNLEGYFADADESKIFYSVGEYYYEILKRSLPPRYEPAIRDLIARDFY